MALHTKMQPKLLNVNRVPGQPKKRRKITLVFDENKRREFLTGFHKRKLQRRQKAKEELQQQLKEERKKIKHEARERFKKLLSSRDVPEIQQLLSQQEYETEGHTVSILELNVADLTENDALIGENKGTDEVKTYEDEENKKCSENDDEIIGMSLDKKKKCKPTKKIVEESQIDNKKDLKKAIKKAALKQVQKSKVFQKKQRLERQKSKKESMKKRRRIEKAQKRSGKSKKKLDR